MSQVTKQGDNRRQTGSWEMVTRRVSHPRVRNDGEHGLEGTEMKR